MQLPENIPCNSWHEAIAHRTSRRKYRSVPISPEESTSLEDAINPLQDSLKSARIDLSREGFENVIWTVVGSYGVVTGAESYAVFIQDKSNDEFKSEVETGILGEALILDATAKDIDTCWVGGMFEEDEILSRHELDENEEIAAITPLGRAKEKLTITEKLAKKFAGSHKRKPLNELCHDDYSDEDFHELPEWIFEAIKSARLAPSAVNRQPWRFHLMPEKNKIKLKSADLKKEHGVSPFLDCGIALLHLLAGARSALAESGDDKNVEYELLSPPGVADIYLT